jgi:predicted ferric reductase
MSRTARTAVWLAALLLAAGGPPVLLLAHGPHGSPAWAFSLALGYAAISFLGLQFLLTARFKWLAAPFGIDLVYCFHRYLALGGFGLVALHAFLAAWRRPGLVGLGSTMPAAHVLAGFGAVAAYLVLIVSSVWRARLRLHYDLWRRLHAGIAVAAFGATAWHAWGSGRYLDAPGKRALFLGAVLAWLLLLAWVRLVRPWSVVRKPWSVVAVRPEAPRVWTVALQPVGHGGLAFEAGQFAWITVGRSAWSMREHPFSIASSALRGQQLEFTVKERGDFTRHIGRLRAGDRVLVDAPYGAFSVDRHPQARGFVFVAGGIGITPILGCLRTLADRGDRRPCVLFYASADLERAAHARDLEALASRLDLRLVYVLEQPPAGAPAPGAAGRCPAIEPGWVTRAVLGRHLPAERAGIEFFLCGPKPMTALVERGLPPLDVPVRHVHTEIFDLV